MPINKLKTNSIQIDAVTADLIATGAITVADISDGEITAAKLHTTLDFSTKTFTMHNNHITQAMVTQHQSQLAIGADQIDSGSPTFGGNVTVTGNLTVNGTTTTLNTETLTVDDNIIVLNNNEAGTPSQNAGIEVERGTSTNVSLRWNETTDKWQFTNDGSTYTDLGAGYANADVDAHLNQSTANTGEYLKWDGADYDWATVPAGYTNSDVDTHLNQSNPTSGYVLSWNGSDYSWVAAGGEITVQDEGSALSTAATTLNFVGAGVTASGTGATKTISIAGSSGGATSAYAKYTYEISATVTSVSGADVNGNTLSYSAGNNVVEVFVNGVKQQEGSGKDYQATTGSSVVFTDNLYNGDLVDVVAYNMFDGSNFNFDGSGNLAFGDNKEAVFGTGSDLRIYHNGSSSLITSISSAPLYLKSNYLYISNSNNSSGTLESANGVLKLKYASNTKLETTNTGVSVTGTLTASVGLYSTDFAEIRADDSEIYLTNAANNKYFRMKRDGSDIDFDIYDGSSTSTVLTIKEDGYVGIGTTSPDKTLTVRGTSGDVVQAKIIYAGSDGNRSGLILQNTHTGGREYGLYVGNNSTGAGLGNSFGIMDNTASAYRLIINSSGNVGIGTTSIPSADSAYLTVGTQDYAISHNGFSKNSYFNGSSYTAVTNSAGKLIQMGDDIVFYHAPTVAAGAAQTLDEVMSIKSATSEPILNVTGSGEEKFL